VTVASTVDWGSVPEWIASIGSVIATLLAVTGLLYEMHKRRVAQAEAAAERRAAEANQARLVSVGVQVRGDGHRADLALRNDSGAPIRAVSPVLYWAESGAPWRIPQLADRTPLAVLGPHESVIALAEVAANEPGPPGPTAVRGAVTFTDAEGRRWLCLANAAAPIPVLDGDRHALQSAVDRS
jgi:hypothetical protein